jgi:Tfp pilus assembly protein PilF
VILFILIKKIPKLRVLDVETVPEEQAARVRERILLERMKRKTDKGKAVIKKGTKPVFKIFGNFFRRIFKKVGDLEKKYQKESKTTNLTSSEMKKTTQKLFDAAQKFTDSEDYKNAEKNCIEIISIDPKNIKAYKLLGQVYFEQKEYKQAQETYSYILKLEQKNSTTIEKKDKAGQKYKTVSNAHELADAYVDLGEVFRFLEDYLQARNHIEKALELEPNNPRNLDHMLEVAFLLKDKSLCFDTIKQLESVNPDNQKLKDLKDKLNQL